MTQSEEEQAWMAALRILAASPKSTRDLLNRLKNKGFSDDEAQSVAHRLTSCGYLNDESYARLIFEKFTDRKPTSRRKIDFELRRRGIPDTLRNKLLQELTHDRELLSASLIASEKFRKAQQLPRDTQKKLIFNHLSRLGFDYQVIQEALNTIEGLKDVP